MFYLLSKILYAMVAPVSMIIILLVLYSITKIKKYLWWGMGLLIFFSNPYISQLAMGWYEVAPVAVKKNEKFNGIIIPGGFVTNYTIDGQLRVNFSDGNDRMMQAIDLFKRGVSNRIIYTAGADTVFGTYKAEAELGRMFLLKCCIPDSCIWIEKASVNTYQNASFTAKMLDMKDPAWKSKKYLLVTSGFHMRRALACFTKAGIQVYPYSTDLRSIRSKDHVINTFLPGFGGVQNWTYLLKELIGLAVYKIKGYI
ncbi:MAG: YdcF family protein [Bacteroidota bacterium]|nr:YdcF family protein [Bacteroidota bacterium]